MGEKTNLELEKNNNTENISDVVDQKTDFGSSEVSVCKKKISLFFQKSISGLVLFFCFIFFPAYLLYNSLNIFFVSSTDNVRQAKLEEMDNTLKFLEKYSNNKRYFHYLLSKISEFAQDCSDPKSYLEINIKNLKEKYPEQIQFIVWDNNGKLINELSDRAGFSYVVNKIFGVLKDVSEAVKNDSSVKISNIDSVKKNNKILSQFFGKIFISENLKFPLINSLNAGPFITEIGKNLSSVWFSIKDKISFLCFFSDDLLNDFTGLKKVVANTKNKNFDYIVGYSSIPNYYKPSSEFPDRYENDLLLALTTFENAGNNVFENDRAIVKMSMPQPGIRTFCFFPKKDEIWDIEYKRNILFCIIFSFLIAFYCFGGIWFLYKRHFFSIRWKLTALFLFANLAPILVLGFIAKGYLENKRISLKNQIVSDLEKSMREVDDRYKTLAEDYGLKLNSIVDKIADKVGDGFFGKPELEKLESLYKDFNCESLFLIASSSEIVFKLRDEAKADQKVEFMASLGESVLGFANKKIVNSSKGKKDLFSNILDPEHSEFIRSYFRYLRKVTELTVGDFYWIYYTYLFGNKNNYNNNYVLMVNWNREMFQNIFIKKAYKLLYKSFPEGLFFVKSNITNFSYGSDNLSKQVDIVLENNSGMTEKISGYIDVNDKRHIFVCLNGTNLVNWVILAFYPENHINKEINLLIVQIVLGAFTSLLLTIIIGHLLSLQFLKPIHNLGEAALAIGERNFSYRVPIGDKDEFGHLNQVFNRVIEGLGDFEVARIVQESLFPGNKFDTGDFSIFGRSVVMTTLGGDYYDCFKINDEYLGIIIGDVSGHGIPAGLMMAMAKSAVLTSTEEIKLNPSALTTRIHAIFHAIKNERMKRMMTFSYFVLRLSDGHIIFTNAGHCFPAIVDSNVNTAEYNEYVSTPLGITARCRCKNQEFDLQKGQSLVLYTDGIVEAANAEGVQYGYERYKVCLPQNYDSDAEKFYYNLYDKVYKQWSSKPDDDLTLIIVNRN